MAKAGATEKAVREILERREKIKQRTLAARRKENLRTPHHAAQRREVSLAQSSQWSRLA